MTFLFLLFGRNTKTLDTWLRGSTKFLDRWVTSSVNWRRLRFSEDSGYIFQMVLLSYGLLLGACLVLLYVPLKSFKAMIGNRGDFTLFLMTYICKLSCHYCHHKRTSYSDWVSIIWWVHSISSELHVWDTAPVPCEPLLQPGPRQVQGTVPNVCKGAGPSLAWTV